MVYLPLPPGQTQDPLELAGAMTLKVNTIRMEVYRSTWNIYNGSARVLGLVFAVFFLFAVFRIRILCTLGSGLRFGFGSVTVLVCELMPDRFQESFVLRGVFTGSGA